MIAPLKDASVGANDKPVQRRNDGTDLFLGQLVKQGKDEHSITHSYTEPPEKYKLVVHDKRRVPVFRMYGSPDRVFKYGTGTAS